MVSTTDKIEKRVTLRAPQERVWRAISDSAEFGSWFGMEVDGKFVAGKEVGGRMKPTIADAEIAKRQEPYKGMRFTFVIDRIEPMRLFSFRWHPYAIDSSVDYSKEPMTLVTFTLEPVDGGTSLTIVESGFDSIPIERRADAFEANEGGWNAQLQLIEKYLLLPKS